MRMLFKVCTYWLTYWVARVRCRSMSSHLRSDQVRVELRQSNGAQGRDKGQQGGQKGQKQADEQRGRDPPLQNASWFFLPPLAHLRGEYAKVLFEHAHKVAVAGVAHLESHFVDLQGRGPSVARAPGSYAIGSSIPGSWCPFPWKSGRQSSWGNSPGTRRPAPGSGPGQSAPVSG